MRLTSFILIVFLMCAAYALAPAQTKSVAVQTLTFAIVHSNPAMSFVHSIKPADDSLLTLNHKITLAPVKTAFNVTSSLHKTPGRGLWPSSACDIRQMPQQAIKPTAREFLVTITD